jgi:O-antigen/teichoic acid export membrane protein
VTADAGAAPATGRGARVGGVGLASLVAAAAGYLVLLVAARVLTPAQNADFLAFWGLLFFFFGVLGGLQNETTRAVHVTLGAGPGTHAGTGPAAGPRVLRSGLLVGTALAAVLLATAPLWGTAVLGDDPWLLVAVVAVSVVAFSGHAAVAGALAGTGAWSTYARLVGAESVVRLLLTAVAAAVGLGTAGMAAGAGFAAATWLGFAVSPAVRAVRGLRVGAPGRTFAAATGQAMAGTAASAALVVGFPVLLRVTTPADAYALAAPLLMAVQLTRAPLLIPLNAYQGVAITHFLAHRDRGARPLLQVAAVVLGVGAVGAVAAALVGPWLMATVLGPDYRVAGGVLAGLTASACALALLTLTGAAVLALGRHRAYATGWLVATAVSAAVLLLPASLELRAVVSLAAGPLVGVVLHAVAVRRATAGPR